MFDHGPHIGPIIGPFGRLVPGTQREAEWLASAATDRDLSDLLPVHARAEAPGVRSRTSGVRTSSMQGADGGVARAARDGTAALI